jgi:GntR family transcriptional regulator / MocR family aminotransferase
MKGIAVDRRLSTPLQQQLQDALRDAILSGRLKAGERVLSSRELQTHLGLSRNTVISALSQLQAEGYLVTVRGTGTFVTDAFAIVRKGDRANAAGDGTQIVPTSAADAFAANAEMATNLQAALPFRPGIPALDLFPLPQFRRALNAASESLAVFDYPEALGDGRLREAVVRRLQQTRGIACTADQVLIAAGAQSAFELIAQVLLRKGDVVFFEEPGYPSARAVFLAAGMRLALLPVDDAGLRVEPLRQRNAKLAYTTPAHQYPTGAVLSLERRLALLDWAAAHDAWIVEDDYDSEFNYTGRPQPALYTLDNAHRVLYVGTFSKTLAPGMRVAYLVVPHALRAVFAAASHVVGGQPSPLLQRALAVLMESGHFGRHITKVRKIYDERRRFLHAEFARLRALRVNDTRTGLHFVLNFCVPADDVALAESAREAGIILPALSSYFYGRPAQRGFVVGFAATPVGDARRALVPLLPLLDAAGPLPA